MHPTLPSTTDSTSILRNPGAALQMLSWCGRGVLVLLLVGWIAWFFPFDDWLDRSGTPLGGDYVMLHVSGETLLHGKAASLYDDRANQIRTAAHFPTIDSGESWPFRYPPITAWLMQGPAHLSFGWSFAAFSLASAMCVVAAFWMLIGALGIDDQKTRMLVFWSLAGWPIVGEAILGGQTAPFALCFVVAGIVALRNEWDFVAGVLLGLCIYKPNIVAVLVIGTLVARPKTFWGMLTVAIPAALISIHTTGLAGLQRYAALAGSLASSPWSLETPFWKVHGLAPLLDLLLPGRGKLLAFLCGIPVAVILGLAWRKADRSRWWLAMGSLLTANALWNPYVPVYDLLLIAPAVLATVYYLVLKHIDHLPKILPALVALVTIWFVGPHLSQIAAPMIGLQIFPVMLLGFFVWQIRELYEPHPGLNLPKSLGGRIVSWRSHFRPSGVR
jgi:hypothetical protein